MKKRLQMYGNVVMIWTGIGYEGKINLRFFEEKMNSQKYINLILERINKYARFKWRIG